MKIFTKIACLLVWCVLFVGSVQAQQKRSASQEQALRAQYGDNFDEVLDKYGDDPESLLRFQKSFAQELFSTTDADAFKSMFILGEDDIGRTEAEPNNFFDTADDITDVLALDGRTTEYNGKLIQGSLEAGDVDVYKFTVDPTKMYYFASTHSFLSSGDDGLAVNMRLFHESDLDTMLVVGDQGIDGNDKLAGDILGRNTDGRNGSSDFRLTGWSAPIDEATGEKLTGDFYLWVFNEAGETGTYFMTAYQIDFDPWVSRAEPNADIVSALTNGSTMPTDGVVRTFMGYSPDTVKVVTPPVPVQSNSVFPQLLAQGDEDVDLYLVNYVPGHTLTIETLPYFGWYRDNDGAVGPGGSRLSDPRIRVYDADFTTILAEDDDAARERMDGPNNIHSRLVLDSDFFASNGITEEGPVWLWVSAWASSTRTITDPGDGSPRSVDNRDPGRFMYDIYTTLVPEGGAEVEPNNSVADATQATAGSQSVVTGSFSDASDEDYYRVFMHEVRMYSIFTANSTVSSDIEVEIYREEELEWDGSSFSNLNLTENLLSESVAGNAGNNDFLISGFVPDESGAYIIKLSSSTPGDYELGLLDKGEIYFGRIANEPDDTAPDALTQEAMQVGPGAQAETALIFPEGDLDHYYFEVGDGFELSLSLGGTAPDLVNDFDATMTLFDADFNEIASDPAAISQTLSAGLYVVRVEALEDGATGFYSLSGGVPFEESEPNESFADANLIALGQVYNADLTAGDVDFYQFNLKAGNLYSFRGIDNNTGSELSVGFFDEVNGTTLLDESGWPDNYAGNFKIANIIPREDATYYLSISGSAGDYKLTSRINEDYLALQSKGEPNNSAAEADAMGAYQSFGADVMFALADPNHPRFFGDEDWFRVEMSAGQTLTAETKPVGGDLWARDTDTRIVIFAADGTTELVNDDDGGNDWYSRAGYIAENDEVVYLQVRTSRDTESADDRSLNRGDYLLNVTLTQGELEPNNVIADASPVLPGLTTASFAADDSVDVYTMSLEADNIYHVRTVRPEEGAYEGSFRAMLFSADDTETNLLSEDNTGYNTRYSGDNLKLNIIPEVSGDYILYLMGAPEDGMYYLGFKGRDISELRELGEPNNTIEDADAIGDVGFNAPGEVTTYMLYNADFPFTPGVDEISTQYSDDLDYYKVELVPGDTMVAETSPVDGPLWPRDTDMFMELYDVEGNQIATNDDGGFDWHSRIEYVAESAGPVYVLVRSQDFEGATDRDPSRAEYNLSITKTDGSPVVITNTEDLETPDTFELSQNYPNPFNPTTTISYSIPESVEVELAVYNILGQRVSTLVSTFQTAGSHQVTFDATGFASGMYLYRIVAGDHVSVKRMMLVK